MDPNKAWRNPAEVRALVEDQMHHLRTLQEMQPALFAAASAADDSAESTVDARCPEAEGPLDESTLADDDHTEGQALAPARHGRL